VNWRELRIEPNFMVKELREPNGANPSELGGQPMKTALSGAGVWRAAKFAFEAAPRFDLDSKATIVRSPQPHTRAPHSVSGRALAARCRHESAKPWSAVNMTLAR
jgi:hypothetical protein